MGEQASSTQSKSGDRIVKLIHHVSPCLNERRPGSEYHDKRASFTTRIAAHHPRIQSGVALALAAALQKNAINGLFGFWVIGR